MNRHNSKVIGLMVEIYHHSRSNLISSFKENNVLTNFKHMRSTRFEVLGEDHKTKNEHILRS